MSRLLPIGCVVVLLAILVAPVSGVDVDPLAVGAASHAFDHIGGIGDQADAAVDSGANIIYTTGFGSLGYEGLPATNELNAATVKVADYIRHAKDRGIHLAIGYVCATSIVKLDTFDRHWTPEFRAQFKSPPREWLQEGSDGKPLTSWYGGDYQPACMSNPDWRTYEKFIVRKSLEAGMDGIFFDNPTVHPHGCYCRFCMEKFAKFLAAEHDGEHIDVPADGSVELLRKLAVSRPKDFLRFRGTVASDFLAEIRSYARTIKAAALITCNNSLNSPEVLFSQAQTYGYNIHAMSAVEDLVVVEDMASQPRILSDGKTLVEYGPVYELLHAISHGKPVVAVTIAEGDYTTPPNLCRLAMAEAAAHGASYLSWPTWPENERTRMAAGLKPEAEFLRQHSALLNDTEIPAEALVFLPFEQWTQTANCQALGVVRTLNAANVQYRVVCEDDLETSLAVGNASAGLIVESPEILSESEKAAIEKYKSNGGSVIWSKSPTWFKDFQATERSVAVESGQPAVRVIVRTQGAKTIVHLLNLNVERLSSFQDRVNPASDISLSLRCGSGVPKSVTALSADSNATQGAVPFKFMNYESGDKIELTLRRVSISTILVIE